MPLPLRPGSRELAKGFERRAQLSGEQFRVLPCREVTAPVSLMKVDQYVEGASRPCLRGSIDLVRKDRDGHRDLNLVCLLRSRTDKVQFAALPVDPRRRGRAVR